MSKKIMFETLTVDGYRTILYMLQVKTGIDIVFIPSFEKSILDGGSFFIEKIFTKKEVLNQNIITLAGLFAAKEAYIKALGKAQPLHTIEIFHDSHGKPYFVLAKKVSGTSSIDLSISHDNEYAVACCVIITGNHDSSAKDISEAQ
jgi:holo-[acyl-carrier protein] synthase